MAKPKKTSGPSILKFDAVKDQARTAKRDGKTLLEIDVEQRFVPPGLIEKLQQTTFAVPVLLTIERPDQSPLKVGSRDYAPSTPWMQQNAWALRMQHRGQKGLLLLDVAGEYNDFLPLKDWVESSPVPLVRAIEAAIGAKGIEEIRSTIEDLSSMEIGCLKIEWVGELPVTEIWTYHYMEPEDKQQVTIEQMLWNADPFSHAFPIAYQKPESESAQPLDDRYGMASIPTWVNTMRKAWIAQRPSSLSDEAGFDFGAYLPKSGNL